MNENRRYLSSEFKRKVAMSVIDGYLSKESARRYYGIKGKSAVTDWVRFYSEPNRKIKQIESSLNLMTSQERDQFEELKAKILFLEQALNDETHRAGLYKTMIEIAEQELNIPIRKKYGAKQLNDTKTAQKK